MRQASQIAICIVAAALIGSRAFAASADPTQIYKWVDSQGVVHYGDSIPPQYAQGDSSELNQQGVVVGHIDRPKNDAELAEEARNAAAERQRAQHDQFLLSTYTSVQDIDQLRDERLDQLDAQVTAATGYIQSLDARLATLRERAAHFKPLSKDPKAAKLPDDLAQDIERTAGESRAQRTALANKRNEEAATRAQFQTDIARYTELTSQQKNPER